MALNQSAINVKPINGAEVTQFDQALNIVSTVNASFLKGASTLKSILSSSISTIVSSFVYPKALTASVSSSVNLLKDVGKLIQYTLDNNVEILIAEASHYLTLTYNSVTTSTIAKALSKTLTILSTSVATIIKAIDHTLSVDINSTVSIIKSALKSIIASVTSTATILAVKIFHVTLSALSTATASLVNSIQKLLTISVNCGIILSKLVNTTINLIATVIPILIANAISFKNIAADRLMYAAVRFRKIFY